MLKKLAVAGAALTAAAFATFYLTKVSEMDIFAYHTFDMPIQVQPLRAGEIVAVNDAGDIRRICDLDVTALEYDEDPVADVYFNSFRESLPDFAAYLAWVGSKIGLGEGVPISTVRRELPFVGRKSSLMIADGDVRMSQGCECRQAARLQIGQRVCVVNASLIETMRPQWPGESRMADNAVIRTVAVDLAYKSNWISDAAFKRCDIELTETAKQARQAKCGGALPIDVRLRKYLGLIDRSTMSMTRIVAQSPAIP